MSPLTSSWFRLALGSAEYLSPSFRFLANVTRVWRLAAYALLVMGFYTQGAILAPPSEVAFTDNIALGKPYTLEPSPNYASCTDSDDLLQLTDGQYTQGRLWTQKGGVGWQDKTPVSITIDLKLTNAIESCSFSTAAGAQNVDWPLAIFLLVSEDGKAWNNIGNLVTLSTNCPPPLSAGYSYFRYRAEHLGARGRFVKFVVLPSGPFTFVDEIEVLRSKSVYQARLNLGEPLTNVTDFCVRTRPTVALQHRLRSDLSEVMQGLSSTPDGDAQSVWVQAEMNSITEAIPRETIASTETFTTVFPINNLHRRIFAVQALGWRRKGLKGTVIWQTNRWEMVRPVTLPIPGYANLVIDMMGNEYRSAAFNMSNAGTNDANITFRVQSLPGGDDPAYVQVRYAPFTDTEWLVPVASALLPVAHDNLGYSLSIAPGLTCQVWLTFHPTVVAPSNYTGHLSIAAEEIQSASSEGVTRTTTQLEVPIQFAVSSVAFPERPTLHLSGWDCTDYDQSHYNVTPVNKLGFVRLLRECYVDSPWADTVLSVGRHDVTGQLLQPPDPSAFRKWIDLWPEAKCYCVFVNAGSKFAGFELGSEPFKRALADWINWWVSQLAEWRIPPSKLFLLLLDEPRTESDAKRVVEYAAAIKAAQPRVVIWEDPAWATPTQGSTEFYSSCDILCPNLSTWRMNENSFADFYRSQLEQGRGLWFYSASGPAQLLDPYSYYRIQEWVCWKYQAQGTAFWSFADANYASSWNAYATQSGRVNHSPLFLDQQSVASSKQLEAIREGIQDFEYLKMLRDGVVSFESQGQSNSNLAAARELLNSGCDRVLQASAAFGTMWTSPNARSTADDVRQEILRALENLR
jgi:hypothetical protein